MGRPYPFASDACSRIGQTPARASVGRLYPYPYVRALGGNFIVTRTVGVTSLLVFPSLRLAVRRQRQEFRKFRNSDGITPVYLTSGCNGSHAFNCVH